jgi:hypothetical protein
MSQQQSAYIIKGADVDLSIFLQIQEANGITLPYDLTSKTVSVSYKNSSNVLVTKVDPQVEVVDAVYANVILHLTDVDTEALKVGFFDFDVIVVEASDTKIWKFEKSVTVKDRVR